MAGRRQLKRRQIDRFLAAAYPRAINTHDGVRVMLRSLLIAGLLLLASVPVRANPLDEGISALNEGDYAKALRLLGPLATKGVPEAQFGLSRRSAFA